MKTKMLIAVLLIGSASCLMSQELEATNSATAPSTNSVATKTPAPLQQLANGATAGYTALKEMSFTNGVTGGLFGLRHASDYGGGLYARTANPTGVNVGFGLAAVYEQTTDRVTLKKRSELNFYDATLNVSLNGTTAIPFINYPIDYVIESGPATNLKDPKTIYEQSLVGVEKTWKWGGKTPGARGAALTVEAGEGHCSRWSSGFFQEVAVAFTYKPHGW